MSVGVAANVKIGPGQLFTAPLANAEPTDVTASWPSGWVALGYTDGGSTFEYAPSFDKVEVEEELDPILWSASSREIHMNFNLAEITARNVSIAWNGGTLTVSGSVVYFDPPDLGAEVSRMLGWESQDHKERLICRKCLQTGNVQTDRKKSPNKALIPMAFQLQAVTGSKPFRHIFDSAFA